MSANQQVVSSRLNILKIENEVRKSKRTSNDYNHFAARCIVLADDGSVMTVGTLRSDQCATELREYLKPGMEGLYRAGYGLRVPDFGDEQGNVVCLCTSLTPETPPKAAPRPEAQRPT